MTNGHTFYLVKSLLIDTQVNDRNRILKAVAFFSKKYYIYIYTCSFSNSHPICPIQSVLYILSWLPSGKNQKKLPISIDLEIEIIYLHHQNKITVVFLYDEAFHYNHTYYEALCKGRPQPLLPLHY